MKNISPVNLPSKTFKEEKLEEIYQKLGNNHNLINAYKKLNYLIENINKNEKCKVKLLYLDVYLNFVTPKCLIIQKLDDINKTLISYDRKLESLKKENDEIKNDNKELKKDSQEIKDENAEIKKDNQELKKDNQELKEKVKTLIQFIKSKFPEFDEAKMSI